MTPRKKLVAQLRSCAVGMSCLMLTLSTRQDGEAMNREDIPVKMHPKFIETPLPTRHDTLTEGSPTTIRYLALRT